MPTLLTSTSFLRSEGFRFGVFELEWSFVATSLDGVSFSHEKRVTWATFK